MNKFIFILIFSLAPFFSSAQTKIHPGFTAENQKLWVLTIQEYFPFEFSNEQWDNILEIHKAYCETLGTRNFKESKNKFIIWESSRIPYLAEFYIVFTPSQLKEMESFYSQK